MTDALAVAPTDKRCTANRLAIHSVMSPSVDAQERPAGDSRTTAGGLPGQPGQAGQAGTGGHEGHRDSQLTPTSRATRSAVTQKPSVVTKGSRGEAAARGGGWLTSKHAKRA